MHDNRSYLVPAACALAFHAALFFGFSHHHILTSPLAPSTSTVSSLDAITFIEPPPTNDDTASTQSIEPTRKGEILPSIADHPEILTPSSFVVQIDDRPSTVLPDHPTVFIAPGSPSGIDTIGVASPATVIDARLLDSPPRARSQMQPLYPQTARSAGVTGKVTVDFVVDITGNVTRASVIHSSDPIFNESTLRAVRSWHFEPGRIQGKPTAFRMRIPILFNLAQD